MGRRSPPVGRASGESVGDPPGDASGGSAPDEADCRQWVRSAVSRYESALTQYAAHILGGDVERGRDLVQETFLRLCQQDPRRVGTHLAEWLYTVCRNLAIDAKRKDRRMRLLNDASARSIEADHPWPADAAERDDDFAAVCRAMEDLPDNQQEVIRLKFQHGMSYKQISQITGLTATNVGFLLHAGLKALRRRMEGDSGGN